MTSRRRNRRRLSSTTLVLAPLLLGASNPSPLIEGVAAFNLHQPRAARVHLMNAVRADPASGLARALLARVELALGDGTGAAADLQQARAIGFPVARTRHLMAEALLLQGDAAGALAEAKADGVPGRYAAYTARMRGRARAALGDGPGAAAEFATALAAAPNSAALWQDLARFRRDTGEAAGAIDAAARAVTLDPGDPDGLRLRGELVRSQFGLVAALPWFDSAIAIDPGNVPALLEKAATLGDLGRYRAMLATTRAVLALDSGNARAFYLQAVLAARAGQPELARGLLERVGARMDAVPGAMLLSGVLAIRLSAGERAIERLGALVALQPDNEMARRLLGLAYWRNGDPVEAISALTPLATRGDRYAQALTGRAYERLGDRRAAAPWLDRAAMPVADGALALDPGGAIDTLAADAKQDAAATVRYVRALVAAGDGSAALVQANRLLRDNPGAPAAHMLVGDVLAAGGRWGEAARAYAAAADIRFSEGVALRLADAQRRAGDAKAASITLGLFLAQNPRSIPALNATSDLLLAAERWDAAIAMLTGLRQRIGDGDAALLNNLAWAWAGKGQPARAIIFAEAAYATNPANPALADNLGWLLFRGGDRSYSMALIEQAVAIAPDDPGLRWHLAQVYAVLGRAPEARATARAAAANPAFPLRADALALAESL